MKGILLKCSKKAQQDLKTGNTLVIASWGYSRNNSRPARCERALIQHTNAEQNPHKDGKNKYHTRIHPIEYSRAYPLPMGVTPDDFPARPGKLSGHGTD